MSSLMSSGTSEPLGLQDLQGTAGLQAKKSIKATENVEVVEELMDVVVDVVGDIRTSWPSRSARYNWSSSTKIQEDH